MNSTSNSRLFIVDDVKRVHETGVLNHSPAFDIEYSEVCSTAYILYTKQK